MTAQPMAQHQGQEVPIIPAQEGGVTVLCVQTFLAALAGLALRLLFVFQFPTTAGDSDLYLQLGRNLVDHHVYGFWLEGHLVVSDPARSCYLFFDSHARRGVSSGFGAVPCLVRRAMACRDLPVRS